MENIEFIFSNNLNLEKFKLLKLELLIYFLRLTRNRNMQKIKQMILLRKLNVLFQKKQYFN